MSHFWVKLRVEIYEVKMPNMGDKVIILKKLDNELEDKGIFVRYLNKNNENYIMVTNKQGVNLWSTIIYKLRVVKDLNKFEL